MPATDVCPNADDLERLVRGSLPGTDVERLTRHVGRCERCTAHVARLRSAAPSTESLWKTEAATVPPPPPPDEDVTFLDPPRAAGELGWLTHYRVLKRLGQGGMGLVLLAEDTLLARQVALKVMQPGMATNAANRDRFLREARAAAGLAHDHVITIYQVSEANGAPFLAMQLLQGESLDGYLKRGKPLSAGHICRIGRETALGLAAAHAKGLIHRDIKPANLWLEAPKGRVKILDFGLARGTGDVQLTGSGMVLGTPAYMAPEQARGQALDGRCDLWSLGVVLYRLCAGRLPFEGTDMIAMLTSIALDKPPALREIAPDMPPELAKLVTLLLSKDPAKRPALARDVSDRLLQIERSWAKTAKSGIAEAASGDQPTEAAMALAEQRSPTPPPRRRRVGLALGLGRWRLALTLTLGAVALVLGGGYLFWPPHTTPEMGGSAASLPPPEPVPPAPTVSPPPPPVVDVVPTPPPERPADARRSAPPATAPPATTPAVRQLTSRDPQSGYASAPLVLEYTNDGKTLVVVDRESIWLRDIATGRYAPAQAIGDILRKVYKGNIAHTALAPDGKTLAVVVLTDDTTGNPHRVVLWDLVSHKESGTLPTSIRYDALAFRADSKLLATSTAEEIRLWDLNKLLRNSRVGTLAEARVTDLAFSPKEPVLAIGKANGQVKLWDMAQNKERWHATTQGNIAVQGLNFSPDGRWLVASTLNDRFLRIWNAATGEIQANPAGMGRRLAFSPDGRFLATGSIGINGGDNRRLDLFDVEAKRMVARAANAHADFIAALAFAPDGKTIVTGSSDKSLKFWPVPELPR